MPERCPRCGVNEYTSYDGDEQPTEEAPYPALSRIDNKTYICSSCGTDEAMRDFIMEPPIGFDDWAVKP